MTDTAILTLGRLPKALDVARALHGAGWRVVVAEPHGRHLVGTSKMVARSVTVTAPAVSHERYLQDLAAVIAAEGASLVVPISEETMHVAGLVEGWKQSATLDHHRLPTLEGSRGFPPPASGGVDALRRREAGEGGAGRAEMRRFGHDRTGAHPLRSRLTPGSPPPPAGGQKRARSSGVAHGVRLFTSPPARVRALHDKLTFPALARAYGVAAPDTAALGSPEAEAIAREGKHVIKPRWSCSGRGVRFADAGPPPAHGSEPEVAQAFVPGALVSSCSIAHAGRIVGTVIYRAALLSGTVAVAFERIEHPAAEAWIERFVAGEGHTGFIAFDLIEAADGTVFGIECNPRLTSGVHFFAPDFLARAILDPETAGPPIFKPHRLMQQFWPALTEVQSRAFRPGFGAALRTFLSARDVSWLAVDPAPLLLQPWSAWGILSEAIRTGRSFGDVATADIAWSAAAALSTCAQSHPT